MKRILALLLLLPMLAWGQSYPSPRVKSLLATDGTTLITAPASDTTTVAAGNLSLNAYTSIGSPPIGTGMAMVSIGYGAMQYVTTHSCSYSLFDIYSVAIGEYSQQYAAGCENVSIGINTLENASFTGSFNIALGNDALGQVTSGNENIGIGHGACGGGVNTLAVTGSFNVCDGSGAGDYLNGAANYNLFEGYLAGAGAAANPNSGSLNVAEGAFALQNISTSSRNVAIGYGAMTGSASAPLTSGFAYNTAVGYDAGLVMQGAASANTVVGAEAGYAITTANADVMVGVQAGVAATSSGNTLVGAYAGNKIVGGGNNTVFGAAVATATLVSGSNNILIGTSSGVDTVASSTSNEINIGGALIGFSIAPTLTSGWGTSPTAPAETSTFSFHATVGATGSPSTTGVIGLPTAPTSWNCRANDLTSNVTARMTAQSASSVTFTWSSAPSNSDVIWFACNAN
jgi:hypothetical protein